MDIFTSKTLYFIKLGLIKKFVVKLSTVLYYKIYNMIEIKLPTQHLKLKFSFQKMI